MKWKIGNPFMKKIRHSIFIFVILFLLSCQAQPTPISTQVLTDSRADEAHQAILEVENAARAIQSGSDNSYYLAVEYAARDALLNFPDDPRAESWKWKMAYYAILAGDTQFGHKTYIDLIDAALNRGEATIESLPSWFHPGELTEAEGVLSFALHVDKISTREEVNKYLVSVNAFPGGACFLTVESSGKYSTSLIFDAFPGRGFARMSYDSLGCTLRDLTNDGNDEVVLQNYIGAHVGGTYLRVMDISTTPMMLLPFADQNGGKVVVQYGEVVKDFPILNGEYQMRTVDYAENCQVNLEKKFEWKQDRFELLDVEFHADVESYAPLKNCLFWSIAYARWLDLEDGIKVIDQALQQYESFAVDEQDKAKLDQVRIEKALLYLFANRPEEMKAVFQDVLDNPYQVNGVWAEPIRGFLGKYKTQSDIYRACNELIACVQYGDAPSCSQQSLCRRQAFDYLVEYEFKDEPLTNLVDNLQSAGVNIFSSGWLDLDYDRREELWFVAAYPEKEGNVTNNLGIVSDYPNGIEMFADLPGLQEEVPEFKIERTSSGQTFVKYSQPWGFLWSRDDITNEPDLRVPVCGELECFIFEEESEVGFAALRHQLQNGADSYQMYVEYMNLKKDFEVKPDRECVECYFDLGYIAELVGDTKTVTDMYSKLVESFPDHPLAILAKRKLGR
jgi:hypothetical protein